MPSRYRSHAAPAGRNSVSRCSILNGSFGPTYVSHPGLPQPGASRISMRSLASSRAISNRMRRCIDLSSGPRLSAKFMNFRGADLRHFPRRTLAVIFGSGGHECGQRHRTWARDSGLASGGESADCDPMVLTKRVIGRSDSALSESRAGTPRRSLGSTQSHFAAARRARFR